MDLLRACNYQDSSEEDEDDDSKDVTHEKSKACFLRSVPHTIGNWSGFVSLSLTNSILQKNDSPGVFLDFVHCFVNHLQTKHPSLKFHSHHDFHVSLSKVFYMQHSAIDSFVSDLNRHVIVHSQQRQFNIVLDLERVHVLVNEDKTRTFFAVPVVLGCEHIKRLIQCVDKTLSNYQMPVYYTSPSIHVSFASVVGDLNHLSLESCLGGFNNQICLSINKIHCKFGSTKNFEIALL